MKVNENDRISPIQYTLLIASVLVGPGVLFIPRAAAEAAGNDAWFVIIVGGLLSIVAAYFLTKLALMFPRHTFTTFSRTIVGKWIGLLLTISFIFYFFYYCAYMARAFCEVTKLYLLGSTPIEAILIFYIWATVFGTRGGIEVISRTCQFLFPIIISIVFILGLSMVPHLDFARLHPFFQTPWPEMLKAIINSFSIYLGFEIVLFIVPYLAKPQNAIKNSITAISMITLLYVFIMIISSALFGATDLKKIIWPMVIATQMIDFPGGIIENQEAIFLAAWTTAAFTSSIILLHFLVQIMAQVIHFEESKPILYFIMPFIYLLTLLPNNIALVFAMGAFIGKYGLMFAIGVPIVLLIIAKVRKTA